MEKMRSVLYSILFALASFAPFFSLTAWTCCDFWNVDDIAFEGRVAYYHPSSGKVRKIYGDGWTDYQVEISKGFCRDWRVWVGASGFSRDGDSIGFHDHTNLQFVPINFGLKYFPPFFPLCEEFKFFIGAGACYSFLNIRDHSDYVHHHTHKEGWGGLIEAGINYYFWRNAYVSFLPMASFKNLDFITPIYILGITAIK